MTNSQNNRCRFHKICEKCGLTRISHKILDEDGQDVATDLPPMGREHCLSDKEAPWGRRWRDRLFRFAESL